jgi:antimicrobial peptide system SdpA family protein
VVYAVHGGVPSNPLRLPFERKLNVALWLPEGWKFFTHDAREERIEMYLRDASGWHDASRGPNSRLTNKLGLDRIGRAQGVELGLISQEVSPKLWQTCSQASAFQCLDSAPLARRVSNRSPSPSLCGEVGLVSRKPVPWAWASQGLHVSMPVSFVRLEVEC